MKIGFNEINDVDISFSSDDQDDLNVNFKEDLIQIDMNPKYNKNMKSLEDDE